MDILIKVASIFAADHELAADWIKCGSILVMQLLQ